MTNQSETIVVRYVLKSLDVEELRDLCDGRHVPTRRSKEDMVAQLAADVDDVEDLLRNSGMRLRDWAVVFERTGIDPASTYARAIRDSRLWAEADSDLMECLFDLLFADDMRCLCANRGLATSGPRSALIRRLLADTAGHMGDLFRNSGWRLDDWREVLDEYGIARRQGFAATIEALSEFFSGLDDEFDQEIGQACADHVDAEDKDLGGLQLRFDPESAATEPWPYQDEAHKAVLTALRRCQELKNRGALLHIATGGGKTFIANNVVSSWLRSNSGYVLWVTKSWWLLRQAAFDRAARVEGAQDAMARIGGKPRLLPVPELRDPWPENGTVVYTSLQTLARRLDSRKAPRSRPTLVVWDEAHWAEYAPLGRKLHKWLDRSGRHCPVLGLTATPRSGTALEVAYARGFPELVADGYLARPIITEIATGVTWEVRGRQGDHGDFEPRDMRALASTAERNDIIIAEYAANQDRYGATLVFACNIDHANELARLAEKRGIAAAAVHCANAGDDDERHITDFKQGRLQLLISVEKLTHGIDIPAIRTVFLCRPTMSDILFLQMVGRGARVIKGIKNAFNLVEFTDNMTRFANDLQRARRYFDGSASGAGATRPSPRGPVRKKHAYDSAGDVRLVGADAIARRPWLHGLTYRAQQTFGIEVELTTSEDVPSPTSPQWQDAAVLVNDALKAAVSENAAAEPHATYGVGDHARWTTEHDSSAGWEVVSRILADESGIGEACDVLDRLDKAIEPAGLRVNYRTGLHLHLGWKTAGEAAHETAARLVRLLMWVHALEPGLATIVAPSRVASFDGLSYTADEPNHYCVPVSAVYPLGTYARSPPTLRELRDVAEGDDGRCTTINLRPFWSQGTVEVRLHGGTTNAEKVAWWLSIWSSILWLAERKEPPVADGRQRPSIAPSLDLALHADTLFPLAARAPTAAWIRKRRTAVAALWAKEPDLRRHWLAG